MAFVIITRVEIKPSLSGYQIWAYAMHKGEEVIVSPGIGLPQARTPSGCSKQKLEIAKRVKRAMLDGKVFKSSGARALPFHLGGYMLCAQYNEPFQKANVVHALNSIGY